MNHERFVVFRADRSALAALPVSCVLETMRPLHVEPIAGAPAFVRGAAIVRGAATPVIDAASLFGARNDDVNSRWISFRAGGRIAVLEVFEILGVRTFDGERAATPALLSRAARAAIAELAALDGELLAVLEAARLVGEDVWRAMETSDAR